VKRQNTETKREWNRRETNMQNVRKTGGNVNTRRRSAFQFFEECKDRRCDGWPPRKWKGIFRRREFHVRKRRAGCADTR
jgi:hypothetical protein